MVPCRRLLRFAATVSVAALGSCFAADPAPKEKFAELRTAKGRVYVNATVLAVEPDGLRLQHDAGVSKVTFLDLPDPVRKKYPFDPERAAEFARAAEAANREAIAIGEQDRLKADLEERKRKAGIPADVTLPSDGPVTMDQVKAAWLLSNSARSLNYGHRDHAAVETDIARYKQEVLTGLHDREAEKAALRLSFEWYLKEGRTPQAELAQRRLSAMESEDLRREEIARLDRLSRSMDRVSSSATSTMMAELANIRQELERLRLERANHP